MEIVLDQVSKEIKHINILQNVNLHLSGGHIYGLRGVNGSGKTMLLRVICGLIRPTSGTVTINGMILGRDMEFPTSVGMMIENPAFLNEFTAEENLEMLSSLKKVVGKKEIQDMLERVGLKQHLTKKYKKYSLGMKQRLGIAAAMFENPQIILLDEPTNALDVDGIAMVVDLLKDYRNQDRIIVVASHEKEFLEQVADTIFEVQSGEVYGG